MKAARIAFVGAGNHATESLYPNIPLIPEFQLAAVCDLDAAKAEVTARRYGARSFTSLAAMLDQVELDGCCVCGPPAMHFEVGMQVLQRGIPLFTEKPPAYSLGEALQLAQAAQLRGTWGMVGFMKRFAPANVLAKEFMSSEAFGSLSSLTVMHGCGPYDDLRRMLYFNGIHMIDLARFLGGEVDRLFAYASDGGRGNFGVAVSGRLKNGGVLQINQNSGHTWQDCYEGVYLSGAQAGVFIDASREVEVMHPGAQFAPGQGLALYGFRARHAVSGNMAGWHAGGHSQRGYWGELSHFAQACLGQIAPTPTLDDGARAVQLIEAIVESARTGKEVVP